MQFRTSSRRHINQKSESWTTASRTIQHTGGSLYFAMGWLFAFSRVPWSSADSTPLQWPDPSNERSARPTKGNQAAHAER